ncbi:MAG: RidA family protein [Clostridiales bacterium]|nr:RidA family protein [Clostridiales bacterium]
MIKTISSKNAPAAIGPYSQAKQVGNLLFTSGQIPLDPEKGVLVGSEIREQTEQVMKNLCEVLKAAGTDFDHVVKTTCFLADIADFAAFNEVYASFISSAPARSCFAVKALPKGALVEVECIAEVE